MTKSPTLTALYELAEQLDYDRELSIPALKERDHQIGLECRKSDDLGKLSHWLEEMSSRRPAPEQFRDRWFNETRAASCLRIGAFVLGFLSMMGFLLASSKGLVNVLVFLALFVVLQMAMSIAAAVLVFKTLRGDTPAVLPINPAKLIVARVFPDKRYLRELQSVVRMVILRYGQESGALFTLGTIAAFLAVAGPKGFTFVWESTYAGTEAFVAGVTQYLAMPWMSLVKNAQPSAQVIADTFYDPTLPLMQTSLASGREVWWLFLFLCIGVYGLLPRLILWLVSRISCARLMREAFIHHQGSELVLLRMSAPVITTQADAQKIPVQARPRVAAIKQNQRAYLLNWANTCTADEISQWEEFASVPADNTVSAGIESLESDLGLAATLTARKVERLLVLVKAWEPPMADLADVLDEFSANCRCVIYLLPLEGESVPQTRQAEWTIFSRGLCFTRVDVQVLTRP